MHRPVGPSSHLQSARQTIEYQSLRTAIQEDIAANLIEHSDILISRGWTETELRELLADVVEPIKVTVIEGLLAPLLKQATLRRVSLVAVKKLQETLASVGDLDPVIVDGDRFIDGRHRVETYARAGKTTIPSVDIGPLLRTDWDRWMNG